MKKRSDFKIAFKLLFLVKPLLFFMLLAVILGIAGHLIASFITIMGGYAIAALLQFPVFVSVTTALLLAGVFAGIRGFFRYGEQLCNHYIAFKLLALIREQVFKALRRLCPAKLEGKDKGNLISLITADVELLEVFYAHTISPVLIALGYSLFICFFISGIHFSLGLLTVMVHLFIGVLIPLWVASSTKNEGRAYRTAAGQLSAYVLESLRGLSETIQYHNSAERLKEMDCQGALLSSQEKRMKQLSGRTLSVSSLLILISDFAMLLLASQLYLSGTIGFDGLLIAFLALSSSFGPVISLANLGSGLQNTFAAGNRILDLLEEAPETNEITGQPAVSFSEVKIEAACFSYCTDTAILNSVDLELPPNKVIGITGKSGSGKSTLLRLLMRFWEVDSGSIKISNTNINTINTSNLRDLEGFMTQETHLFQDTIANNIRIAKQDATLSEIEAACKKASIHDFILSLPQGYQTPVGELGETLSGGERQRLGLARIFLHDAPLFLLDEPTSNLDSLNEAIILQSLKKESAGKTIVLVSHRQSTLKIAETIFSMENGRMS